MISYLGHANNGIPRGAAKLIGTAIDDLLIPHPGLGSIRPDEFYRPSINHELAFDLLESDDRELKRAAIKLLTISTFSIDKVGKQLLSYLLDCNDEQEAEAWGTFFLHTQLSEGHIPQEMWLGFFESILEKVHRLMPIIQEMALSRYESAVVSQTSGGLLYEQELGLPIVHNL